MQFSSKPPELQESTTQKYIFQSAKDLPTSRSMYKMLRVCFHKSKFFQFFSDLKRTVPDLPNFLVDLHLI